MKDVYIKMYLPEDDTSFYIHFKDEDAIRQINITPEGTFRTSTENPFNGDAMLYDQDYSELEINTNDFITEVDFLTLWNNAK